MKDWHEKEYIDKVLYLTKNQSPKAKNYTIIQLVKAQRSVICDLWHLRGLNFVLRFRSIFLAVNNPLSRQPLGALSNRFPAFPLKIHGRIGCRWAGGTFYSTEKDLATGIRFSCRYMEQFTQNGDEIIILTWNMPVVYDAIF